MLLIRGNSAAAKVVRSGEPLLLLAPSLRVIGSPLEMLDGEPQLAGMRRVILMCARAVFAACAPQPPMPDEQAAARVWFESGRFAVRDQNQDGPRRASRGWCRPASGSRKLAKYVAGR